MGILYLRDDSGKFVPVPGIKGEKGDTGGVATVNGIFPDAAGNVKLGVVHPYNLLDNSDFRNPVNQRGFSATSSTAGSMCLDRWHFSVQEGGSITLTDDGLVCNRANLVQKIAPGVIDRTKTYTQVIYFADGTARIVNPWVEEDCYSNGSMIGRCVYYDYIGTIAAVALYEGSYTDESIPPYVPKGYAPEFMECRRYYQKTIPAVLYCYADSYLFPFVMETPTHRVPTYSIVSAYTAAWDEISGDITVSDVTNYGVGVFQNASFKAGNYYRLFIEVNADL